MSTSKRADPNTYPEGDPPQTGLRMVSAKERAQQKRGETGKNLELWLLRPVRSRRESREEVGIHGQGRLLEVRVPERIAGRYPPLRVVRQQAVDQVEAGICPAPK